MRMLPTDRVTVTITIASKLHDFVEGVRLNDTAPARPWFTHNLPPHIRQWVNRHMATAPADAVVLVTDHGRAPLAPVVLASIRFDHA